MLTHKHFQRLLHAWRGSKPAQPGPLACPPCSLSLALPFGARRWLVPSRGSVHSGSTSAGCCFLGAGSESSEMAGHHPVPPPSLRRGDHRLEVLQGGVYGSAAPSHSRTAGQTAAQEEAEGLSTDRPLPFVSQQPARPSIQTAPSQVGPGLCGSCSPSQPPPSSSSSRVLMGKGGVAWDWSLGRQRVFRQAGLTPSQEGPSRLTGAFSADSQSN